MSSRSPDRPRATVMPAGILARVAKTVAVSDSAAKRRRVSSKVAVDGLANSFTSTVDTDIDYISMQLKVSPHLAGWLASQLRDGTLEAAWKRTQSKECHEWAPSSSNMRHIGIKITKDFLASVAPHFAPEALEENTIYVSAAQGLRFLTYALNVRESCFLPSANVEASLAVFQKRYADMGKRLSDAPTSCTWQSFGYFALDPEDHLTVRALRSPAKEWHAKLPLTAEAFSEVSDWRFENNWSTKSVLKSPQGGHVVALRPLFVKKYGLEAVDHHMPVEVESFEGDGRSPPAWLGSAVGKKQGTSGREQKQESLAQARAAARALEKNACAISPRGPPARGTGQAPVATPPPPRG